MGICCDRGEYEKLFQHCPSPQVKVIMLLQILIVLLVVIVSLAGVLLFGAWRWQTNTQKLRSRLESARIPMQPQRVDFAELAGLPAPVQRYFRKVLTAEQPLIASVQVQHSGTFNLGNTAAQWQPFTSDQRVVTQRPGFDWDARIAIAPGLAALVHDAYIAGEGILHATLAGLISVANLRGTGDIAKGELMRFLAEAAWYPTALLPSQGIKWEAVDDRSAQGTLTDGAICLTMLFVFNEQDLIETVTAEARGRNVDGKMVPTPWQGRFWNYAERDGMQVPLDGEVAWLLPEGRRPYWRGRIAEIRYEFTL